MQVAEVSSENSYGAVGVKQYRRTVALLGGADATEHPFLLDIFRVKGGSKHDYMFHSRSEDAEFQGIEFGPETSGSLAAAE